MRNIFFIGPTPTRTRRRRRSSSRRGSRRSSQGGRRTRRLCSGDTPCFRKCLGRDRKRRPTGYGGLWLKDQALRSGQTVELCRRQRERAAELHILKVEDVQVECGACAQIQTDAHLVACGDVR